MNSPVKSGDYLFVNRSGQQFTRAGIAYIVQKYTTLVHNENPMLFPAKLTPHCLRHTKAMLMLSAGQNLIYIRDVLGHSSIKTTEIYARISSKQQKEAIEAAQSQIKSPDTTNIDYRNDKDTLSWLNDYCK